MALATHANPTVDISIVIVNWNTRVDLRRCLESLESSPSSLSTEVIVVDNASSDGSADLVALVEAAGFVRAGSDRGGAYQVRHTHCPRADAGRGAHWPRTVAQSRRSAARAGPRHRDPHIIERSPASFCQLHCSYNCLLRRNGTRIQSGRGWASNCRIVRQCYSDSWSK